MILRELYYADRDLQDYGDNRYDPTVDTVSPYKREQTRRTRLTLSQINRARRADELHAEEHAEELSFVKQMYGIISQAQMASQGEQDFGGI